MIWSSLLYPNGMLTQVRKYENTGFLESSVSSGETRLSPPRLQALAALAVLSILWDGIHELLLQSHDHALVMPSAFPSTSRLHVAFLADSPRLHRHYGGRTQMPWRTGGRADEQRGPGSLCTQPRHTSHTPIEQPSLLQYLDCWHLPSSMVDTAVRHMILFRRGVTAHTMPIRQEHALHTRQRLPAGGTSFP